MGGYKDWALLRSVYTKICKTEPHTSEHAHYTLVLIHYYSLFSSRPAVIPSPSNAFFLSCSVSSNVIVLCTVEENVGSPVYLVACEYIPWPCLHLLPAPQPPFLSLQATSIRQSRDQKRTVYSVYSLFCKVQLHFLPYISFHFDVPLKRTVSCLGTYLVHLGLLYQSWFPTYWKE